MTVLTATRLALADLIAAQLPTVQVSAFPCGETQDPRECVHLEGSESRFEWRSIGNDPKNRTEDIEIEIVVHAYREAPDHRTAAAEALARCEELLAEVEAAVVTDPAGAFTVGGNVTHARISGWTVRPVPREAGWAAEGRARLTARNHP